MKCPLIFCLLFTAQTLFGQINISCNYREICKWNAYDEVFDRCSGYEESSLFKINEAETMFSHTTETMKSAYYINSKKQDEEGGVWELDVESDAGNSYLYFLDFEHEEVRVLAKINDELLLIRFYIKRYWTGND